MNYGTVSTGSNHAGGIVGYVDSGTVSNNANYGPVSGASCVGGIVGENYSKRARVHNSFNVGEVRGTANYVGAVVGRNNGDDGEVYQCYYLQGSATCNGAARTATGTKDGAEADNGKHVEAAYFTSPDSGLSRDCQDGKDSLIGALNHWAARVDNGNYAASWTPDGPGGYPVPEGSYQSVRPE